jgi:hypothetical protein
VIYKDVNKPANEKLILMQKLTSSKNEKMGSNRSFGLVFSTVFTLLALLFFYNDSYDYGVALLGGALLLLVISLTFPQALKIPNLVWFKFGQIIHTIMNPIILGLIFFLTVTPTAIIMRMLGKDLLRLKLDPQAKSYWIHRIPSGPEPQSMKRQF